MGSVLAASAATAQTKLLFGYALSAENKMASEMIIPWLDAVEKNSNGEIDTEFQGGGSIVTFTAALQALQGGLVDSTMVAALFFRKELPTNTLLVDIGATFGNQLAASAALFDVVTNSCDDCATEMRDWNAVAVTTYVSPPYNLACREMINSADDMRNKRVRAIGLVAKVVEEMGAVPVNVAVTEMYEALQRGVIDCALIEATWLEQFSLKEVVKHYIDVNTTLNASPALLAVRGDWWDGLNEAQKSVVLKSFPEPVARELFNGREFNRRVRETNKDTITFSPAPDWAVAAVERAGSKIRQEAVTVATNSGVADPQALADKFIERYEAYTAQFKDKELTQEDYAKFVADNFYADFMPK